MGSKRLTKEKVIEKAKKIHGDKYDYSEFLKEDFIFNGKRQKIPIICHEKDKEGNEHGIFWQLAQNHYTRSGCPKCNKEQIGIRRSRVKDLLKDGIQEKRKNEIVEKSKQVHKIEYDYSLFLDKNFIYKGNKIKIPIICHNKDDDGNEHGVFWQTPNNHMKGQNCPLCQGVKRYTTETFIKACNKVHNYEYTYDGLEYNNSHIKVPITCKKHGVFYMRPYEHLQGARCPKCYGNIPLTTKTFIERANKVHNNKFDYSKVDYVNSSTKICIICPIHGEFWQLPSHHLRGVGCPRCNTSHLERKMEIFLKKRNINYEREKVFEWLKWKKKGVMKLDFYLPQYNVAIECQGEQHFYSSKRFNLNLVETIKKRDLVKLDICNSHGIEIYYYTEIKLEKYPYNNVYTSKKEILKQILKKND